MTEVTDVATRMSKLRHEIRRIVSTVGVFSVVSPVVEATLNTTFWQLYKVGRALIMSVLYFAEFLFMIFGSLSCWALGHDSISIESSLSSAVNKYFVERLLKQLVFGFNVLPPEPECPEFYYHPYSWVAFCTLTTMHWALLLVLSMIVTKTLMASWRGVMRTRNLQSPAWRPQYEATSERGVILPPVAQRVQKKAEEGTPE